MTTPSVSARPRVTTVKVDTLLQWASRGQLRLPAFQRPLRWKRSDVLDLFDSVRRGFPIGTVLLAEQRLNVGETRFGPFVAKQVDGVTNGYSIIDGQQRITTLVGTLLHPEDQPAGDDFSVYFDLEDERFFVLGRRRSVPETAIPLRVMRNLSTSLAWGRGWHLAKERPDLLERADQLAQTLREFELAAAIVDGRDETSLRDIFVRTNKAGVKLKASEIFEALHATSPEQSVTAACARLAEAGASNVDGDFFLRCLLHVGALDPGAKVRELNLSGSPLVQQTETALTRAIGFLRADAEVARAEWLPQNFPLLPLAGFFDRFPDPSPRARRLLRRWFWNGMVADVFADNGFGAVRRWQALVQAGGSDDQVASTMASAVPAMTAFAGLQEAWDVRHRGTWFLKVALFSQTELNSEIDFDGTFLDDARHTGGWIPLSAEGLTDALRGATGDALTTLGFSPETTSLLRAYLAAPSSTGLDTLTSRRLPELARLTEEFLLSVCEPSLSNRPSIETLVSRTRGAA